MIRGENLPPPLSQNSILGKKGGGAPQIRQKFNQLRFVSNFQGNLRPMKDFDERWIFFSSLSQNLIIGKKGGGTTPNQAKIQPTWIWLKISG